MLSLWACCSTWGFSIQGVHLASLPSHTLQCMLIHPAKRLHGVLNPKI